MQIFENSQIVTQIANELIKSKNFDYSQFQLDQNHYTKNIKKINLSIKDDTCQTSIKNYLFESQNSNKKKCIIYCHGFSSFALQGKFLISYVNENISVLLFDFVAHGKTTGNIITYGYHQASNIRIIVEKILQRNYQQIILWGRSMGAVAILLYLKNKITISEKIRMIILDSPFTTFQQITKQIAIKKYNIPIFLLQVIINMIRMNIKKRYSIDLFKIDVRKCPQIKVPAIFISSKNDSLIDWKHSESIYNFYQGDKTKFTIDSNHNDRRSKELIDRIIENIHKIGSPQFCLFKKGIRIVSGQNNQLLTQSRLKKNKKIQITTSSHFIQKFKRQNII